MRYSESVYWYPEYGFLVSQISKLAQLSMLLLQTAQFSMEKDRTYRESLRFRSKSTELAEFCHDVCIGKDTSNRIYTYF